MSLELIVDHNDRIVSNVANAYRLLKSSPEWHDAWGYDKAQHIIVVLKEGLPVEGLPRPGERWRHHHTTRVLMWVQDHGLYRGYYKMVYDAISMLAHEHEFEGVANDPWLPAVQEMVRTRLRVLPRHLVAQLLKQPLELVAGADVRRMELCLVTLGFERRLGFSKRQGRFNYYLRAHPNITLVAFNGAPGEIPPPMRPIEPANLGVDQGEVVNFARPQPKRAQRDRLKITIEMSRTDISPEGHISNPRKNGRPGNRHGWLNRRMAEVAIATRSALLEDLRRKGQIIDVVADEVPKDADAGGDVQSGAVDGAALSGERTDMEGISGVAASGAAAGVAEE